MSESQIGDPRPVHLSHQGPPETVMPPVASEQVTALQAALDEPDPAQRRAQVAAVAARWPRYLDAWARLGELASDPVESYAYYRVGYHRGLDQLRQAGWRGTGYVRRSEPTNLGFLSSLDGLSRAAGAIGEQDEADRCAEFLAQLDPTESGPVRR
jgi:hypothetical protein